MLWEMITGQRLFLGDTDLGTVRLVQAARIPPLAQYVKDVLDGANPGDMPVSLLSAHELVVNLRTAEQIGVTVPKDVIDRALEVIR